MDSPATKPIRILFVISNLSYAGAQRQLLTLVKHMDRDKFEPEICTLSPHGQMEPEIERLGIPLWKVLKSYRLDPWIFVRFANLCRRREAQVVYSFLDFDNLVGRVGGWMAGVPLLIASERNSDYTLPGIKKHLERWSMRFSDVIITNSLAGRDFLIRDKQVSPDRIKVIHNSLDPAVLASTASFGGVRTRFSIPEDAIVIGMAARRRPEKNYELFFAVAEQITIQEPNAWFLHVGDAAPTFEHYSDWMETRHSRLTHQDRVILGGHCLEMAEFYRDIDILLITSDREGLSNTLMESMAMGLPAITTDVGDNRHLLADKGGLASPPGDSETIVRNLSRLIVDGELRRKMGDFNKNRAKEMFSVDRMVQETQHTILELYRAKKRADSKQLPTDVITH